MTFSSAIRVGLTILVAFRLGATAAWAQLPAQGVPPAQVTATREQVPAWLRSADAREVAWGASFAAQYRMANAVPLLVDALQRTNVDDNSGEEVARTAALLDALIQLDARLDPALVRRFLPLWSVQTLILLDRASSGRADALVSALDETEGKAWRATVALLFASRPQGLLVRVLRPMRFSLKVTVQDQAGGGLGEGSGGGVEEGCQYARGLIGFPPVAEYQFSWFPQPGAVVLALPLPGASYVRTVRPDRVPCWSPAASKNRVTLQERLDYAMAFVLPRSVLPWEMPRNVFQVSNFGVVVWTGPRDFPARVWELRRGIEGRYEGLLRQLTVAKLLTEAESKELSPVVVAVTLVDQRKNQTTPLPPID